MIAWPPDKINLVYRDCLIEEAEERRNRSIDARAAFGADKPGFEKFLNILKDVVKEPIRD